MTHICVSKFSILGSDNGLSPGRRQAIIWTKDELLLIGPLGTNFNEILIKIHTFYSRKCIWKGRLENGGHSVSASICEGENQQTGMTTHGKRKNFGCQTARQEDLFHAPGGQFITVYQFLLPIKSIKLPEYKTLAKKWAIYRRTCMSKILKYCQVMIQMCLQLKHLN